MSDLIADPETDAGATYAVDPALAASTGPPHRGEPPRAQTRTHSRRSPVRRSRCCRSPAPGTSRSPSRAPAPRSARGPRCRSGRRAAVLLRFHDLVLDRQDEVLDLIQIETGKARLHAFEEVLVVAIAARHYGRKAPSYLRASRTSGRVPGAHPVRRAAPAAGRRRPDRPVELPARAVRQRRAARAAGRQRRRPQARPADRADRPVRPRAADRGRLPRGPGPGGGRRRPVVGTGDRRARRLRLLHRLDAHRPRGRRAGRRPPRRRHLELGGKNALLRRCGRRPDRPPTARSAPASPRAGQLCISVERMFVHDEVADAFLDRFAARRARCACGPAMDSAWTSAR